jgi:hypothetical protein
MSRSETPKGRAERIGSPDTHPAGGRHSAHDAVVIANHGGLAVATSITVRCVEGDSFERIIDWELGPVPESISAGEATEFDPSSIPF